MKKESLFEVLIGLFTLAPLVYLAIIWNSLPEQVPTHFNIEGQPDRYSGKFGLLLPILLTSLPIWALLRFLPAIDPKGKLQENPGLLRNIRLIMAIFMGALGMVIIQSSQSGGNGLGILLPVVISGMFAALGNYLINIKPNYFIGIRTPWTLESEQVWRKTHRVGGRMMFFGGLLSMLLSLVLPFKISFIVFTVLIVVISLVPVVLSYFYYRAEKTQ